jgi:flavin-dependent dehydrogenase
MAKSFDAIVVGARCAGSPTAMLLARKGYRVLLVDRARFPSDTVSTHLVPPAWCRSALTVGSARPLGGNRLPADPHL